MEKEIIKDVIGFEGLYKISSLGKIWRCKSKKRLVNGRFLELPERELKIGGKVTYPTVSLLKDGKQHCRAMHRLMAIHFLKNDNPLMKNEVNHKNKNIFDFSLSNLEWCTRSENMKHAKSK